MTFEEYKKIILEDEKVEWYGVDLPKGLLTPAVKMWSDMVVKNIEKMESEDNISKNMKDYINKCWENVKLAPYTLNRDFYLIRKKRIEEELNNKPKKRRKKNG